MYYGWQHTGIGIGGWIVMLIAMVVFWSVIVFGVVALVRYLVHHGGPAQSATGDQAETILRERFAKGEINEDEYRAKLDLIRSKR